MSGILWNHNINHPEFWRTCGDCGTLHGPYATLAQAQHNYRCPTCEDKMRDAWRAAAGHIT